tara:strand:- start:52 stop:408 length:357 start_codon:yes stop_codon:yes gene_type:complete
MSESSNEIKPFIRFLHLLNALEGLSSYFDLNDLIILAKLQKVWSIGGQVMINDLKSSIASISESTINRRIRKLKKLGIIRTRIDQSDERIRYIEADHKYDVHLDKINDFLAKNNEKLL